MTKPVSKLSLNEVTALAREVVRGDNHVVIGTVPTGGSEYAELIVALNVESDSTMHRMTIGVHRTESADCIREQIADAFAREGASHTDRASTTS